MPISNKNYLKNSLMLPVVTKQGKNKTARITPSHNASRSPSSLPSHLCRCFCFLCRPSLSFLSSLTRLFLIFAILRRRLCHHRRHSPSFLPSLPSFAVVSANFLSASPSFLSCLTRLFLIFAVLRSRFCRPSPSSSPSFLSSSRRSLSSLLSSLSFLSSFVAVFVGVFAVRPSSFLKCVKRKTQRVRILVVCNLPTGPQLRSASFQSANYTYAGPQVRILPVLVTNRIIFAAFRLLFKICINHVALGFAHRIGSAKV